MFEFSKTKKTAADNGKQFMAKSKEEHEALFQSFAENSADFDSFTDFCDALESQSWELLEAVCKASYSNGIKKGQRRQKSSR